MYQGPHSEDEILAQASLTFKESHQSEIAEATFLHNLRQMLGNESSYIASSEIGPVTDAPHLSELAHHRAVGEAALSELIVCKLNGGLGTSMGLECAKSLLAVRDGVSFLNLTLQQISYQRSEHGVELPFVTMNSFRTEDDTQSVIPRDFNDASGVPVSMRQHQIPKIDAQTLTPVKHPQDPSLEWCPPGHGDLYPVLVASGVLEQALAQGKRYLFVSNSDNLGATVCPELLGYMVEAQLPFLMESAERTVIDRKGGHLARSHEGQLLLRERAQVAEEDQADFQNFRKYTLFNTNSLWIDLQALKQLIEDQRGIVPLPVIRNEKTVDSRDPNSTKVIQLETAMGSAISLFPGAGTVVVPRSRFLPVKTTDDLLRVRSDLFTVNERFELNGAPSKQSLPISLDPRFYGRVDDFEARFASGVPSLVNATSLNVIGNVSFGRGVQCHGAVVIEHSGSGQLAIPDGEILRGS